jgi:two-component system heavy metal sensor histidine kinase CusS
MRRALRFRSRLVLAVIGVTMLTLGGAFFAVFRLMNAENERQVEVALAAELSAREAFRLDVARDAAFLQSAMVIVFAVAVLWAALVATWLIRRLTRGHAAVTSVARQVADGNLSARVPDTGDPEMAQLGRDVNHMIERLAKLLRAQEEFITHAAHELRSPLTTLSGELTLALRRSRDVETYRETIHSALESAQRLKALAETLLTMARIDGASQEPLEIVSMTEVLERASRAVSAAASHHDVTIAVEGDAASVSGRSQDLERLFCNLLENAIRFSPQGGRVHIRLAGNEDHVSVRVLDQGPGVADADRERIFQPFFRSRSAYGTPGYGLGLAIAAKVVRAHGGRISLAASGIGAEFVVELPRATA